MASARDRLRSRSGQSLPEYTILLALVAIGLVVLLMGFGRNVRTIYGGASKALGSVASAIGGGDGGASSAAAGSVGSGNGGTGGAGGSSGAGGSAGSAPGDGGTGPGGGAGGSQPIPGITPQ